MKLEQGADVNRLSEEGALPIAKAGMDQMASSLVIEPFLREDDMADEAVDEAESFSSIWGSVLNKLEIFTEITELISEVRSLLRNRPLTA